MSAIADICRGCSKIHTGLQQCKQCKSSLYCGRQCQVAHWDKLHKYECVPLASNISGKIELIEGQKRPREEEKNKGEDPIVKSVWNGVPSDVILKIAMELQDFSSLLVWYNASPSFRKKLDEMQGVGIWMLLLHRRFNIPSLPLQGVERGNGIVELRTTIAPEDCLPYFMAVLAMQEVAAHSNRIYQLFQQNDRQLIEISQSEDSPTIVIVSFKTPEYMRTLNASKLYKSLVKSPQNDSDDDENSSIAEDMYMNGSAYKFRFPRGSKGALPSYEANREVHTTNATFIKFLSALWKEDGYRWKVPTPKNRFKMMQQGYSGEPEYFGDNGEQVHENGVPIYRYDTDQDGKRTAKYQLNDNGTVYMKTLFYENGVERMIYTYNDNGTMEQREGFNERGHVTFFERYDENGVIIERNTYEVDDDDDDY